MNYKTLLENIESYRFAIASTPMEDRNSPAFNLNVREHYELQKQYQQLTQAYFPELVDALQNLVEAVSPIVLKMPIRKSFHEHNVLAAANKVLHDLKITNP